jgi:hypothetical protein
VLPNSAIAPSSWVVKTRSKSDLAFSTAADAPGAAPAQSGIDIKTASSATAHLNERITVGLSPATH